MGKINLLLIGLGPHAKRIYYPICKKEEGNLDVQIVHGVDLTEKKADIKEYLKKQGSNLPMYYVDSKNQTNHLSQGVEKELNKIVDLYKIKGVIVSTEPLAHKKYAIWALGKGLHILMDKPISASLNTSISEDSAKQIIKDFDDLGRLYKKTKAAYKNQLFTIMVQRRYHPAFIKVRDLIREVFQATNCPITSIQSTHADGQWRLPSEIIDIKYHSFNNGYGKCFHTGYHSFDLLMWLQGVAASDEKKIDNVDIFTNVSRPSDFISQLNLKDYEKIFPGFRKHNRYTEKEFLKKTKQYGEIDAFNSVAFKHGEKVITLASVNLLHNSYSQRGWLKANKDLYKGNGRVRHESHFIEQGPFQAISIISYQSNQVDTKMKKLYDAGGEYHLDIHIFRNSNLFPKWKAYERISIKDLEKNTLSGYSRGHQEEARRKAIIEFITSIKDKKDHVASNLLDHEKSIKLLAGVYMSIARRYNNGNPLVNIKF